MHVPGYYVEAHTFPARIFVKIFFKALFIKLINNFNCRFGIYDHFNIFVKKYKK